MNTRRAIFKIIGAVPMAAASVKGEIGTLLASPALAAATALASHSTMPQPAGSQLGFIGKELAKLRRLADSEANNKRCVRIGNLDPDIAALRSVSPAIKAQKQYERDMADAHLGLRIEQVLYGDPH